MLFKEAERRMEASFCYRVSYTKSSYLSFVIFLSVNSSNFLVSFPYSYTTLLLLTYLICYYQIYYIPKCCRLNNTTIYILFYIFNNCFLNSWEVKKCAFILYLWFFKVDLNYFWGHMLSTWIVSFTISCKVGLLAMNSQQWILSMFVYLGMSLSVFILKDGLWFYRI